MNKQEMQKKIDDFKAFIENEKVANEIQIERLQEMLEDCFCEEWGDPETHRTNDTVLSGDGIIYSTSSTSLRPYWKRGRTGTKEYLKAYDKAEIATAIIKRYRKHIGADECDWSNSIISKFCYAYDWRYQKFDVIGHTFYKNPNVIYWSKYIEFEDLPSIVQEAYNTLLECDV